MEKQELDTLPVKKEKLIELLGSVDKAGREVIYSLVGGKEKIKDITEIIRTVQDAYHAVDMKYDYDGFSFIEDMDLREKVVAYHDLLIVAKALNEDWVPNFKTDVSRDKVFIPTFTHKREFDISKNTSPSTRDHICFHVVDSLRSFNNGCQLVYKSRELAEYAGRQFLHLYSKI